MGTGLVQAVLSLAGTIRVASGWPPCLGPLHLYSLPLLSASRTAPTRASDRVTPQHTHQCSAPLLTHRIMTKFISQTWRAFHDLTSTYSSLPIFSSLSIPCSSHSRLLRIPQPCPTPSPLPGHCSGCALCLEFHPSSPPCIHPSKPFPWAPCPAFAVLPALIWWFSFQTPWGILPILI